MASSACELPGSDDATTRRRAAPPPSERRRIRAAARSPRGDRADRGAPFRCARRPFRCPARHGARLGLRETGLRHRAKDSAGRDADLRRHRREARRQAPVARRRPGDGQEPLPHRRALPSRRRGKRQARRLLRARAASTPSSRCSRSKARRSAGRPTCSPLPVARKAPRPAPPRPARSSPPPALSAGPAWS